MVVLPVQSYVVDP